MKQSKSKRIAANLAATNAAWEPSKQALEYTRQAKSDMLDDLKLLLSDRLAVFFMRAKVNLYD